MLGSLLLVMAAGATTVGAATHDWDGYRSRLAAQAPRWDVLGMDHYRSPQVPRPAGAMSR
ncbi:hypothetical protein OHB56_16070 [Streptomyces sp. NBC_01635]|uniref:hypothetical protein n=1 Tax=Streptomyces sp. NBC_01635 TaxID=2975904 RepID=UPI00386EFB2A|nr:hypothetical protein OHB56_16070 [Streptomyces sp. NBC_01635]